MAEVADLQFLPIEEPNDESSETLSLDTSPQLLSSAVPDPLPSPWRLICPYRSDLVVVDRDLVDHQRPFELFPESEEIDPSVLGLGLESDPHLDEQIAAVGDGSDGGRAQAGLSLCWDCLHLDPNEEFEWEEVEERETLNMMEELNLSHVVDFEQEDEITRNAGWELLLSVGNLGRNPAVGPDEDDDFYEPFDYTSEYDDAPLKGGPPASKSAVENLPAVVLTGEDVEACAVCKDEIFTDQRARKLPCSHRYHEECIFPWLGIRNTCPLCRFELPTDDPEYEKLKARRAVGGIAEEESWVRYDFEILHEE